jgi:hypothetical protein
MLSSRRCLDIRNIASSEIPLNVFMTLSKTKMPSFMALLEGEPKPAPVKRGRSYLSLL